MKTIKEIAVILKIAPRTVGCRFDLIGIIGKKRIRTRNYTDEQLERISFSKWTTANYPQLSGAKYYENQIKVIETYLEQPEKNITEVSKITNISEYTCGIVIRRWRETGCILIRLSMVSE